MTQEVLKQALEALEASIAITMPKIALRNKAILALQEALAQPQQEPVAWISHNAGLYHFKPDESLNPLPLYISPPAQSKPLTDKQILADETLRYYFGLNGGAGPVSKQGRKIVNAIEAAHGIKGAA